MSGPLFVWPLPGHGPSVPDDHLSLQLRVPRSALVTVAQPPEWISQRTVEREVGVGPRSYLADVGNSMYTAEVIKRGKLRITRLRDYIDYLRAVSQARQIRETGVCPDGAAAVLAEIGLKMR